MAHWTSTDAKSKFGALINQTRTEGAQIITRNGVDVAVVIPFSEWTPPPSAPRLTVKEWLLYPGARFDLDELIPPRGE
jgi:antitoxin Phd